MMSKNSSNSKNQGLFSKNVTTSSYLPIWLLFSGSPPVSLCLSVIRAYRTGLSILEAPAPQPSS